MSVISIQRDLNSNVCFVRMMVSDNLATVAQPNYIANNQETINALNGGTFGWFMSDMLLVAASDGNALLFFTDDTFTSLKFYGEQGSGMINPGLINELAYYPANGSTLSGLATANNGVLITSGIGAPSISSILPSAVQLNITSVGTLLAGTWTASTITVPFGGTGNTSFTAYTVICAGITSTGAFQNVASVGSVGDVFVSNGPGALPSFQTGIASGIINTGNQNDLPFYSASPSGKTLSAIAGAVNAILVTSGLGVPSLGQTLPGAVQLNITSVGTLTAGTWTANTIGSTWGGTGISNPTAHGIMIAEGVSPMVSLVLGAGQIPIGTTSGDPSAAAINSGTGILVGNASGSITVSLAPIASLNILSNITGGSAAPIANTLTATIDAAIGNTQGDILYRNSTVWTVLPPSTAGFVLTTGGVAANPSWTAITATGAITNINGDSGSVTPSSGVVTISGGTTGLTTSGASATLSLTGTLKLTNGGTNASLTASSGGIVYSTASALAILAGTATAGQLFLSGASTTPSWSTSTYPSTNAINTLLYASSANVMAALATANNGILATNGSGVPSITSALPQAVINNLSAPQVTILTSGSGNYTTAANVKYLLVECWGGGGGGGGGGSVAPGTGTGGGNTTFGTALLTANGGGAGAAGGTAGGTATGGDINISGYVGGTNLGTVAIEVGGSGGSAFKSPGSAGTFNSSTVPTAPGAGGCGGATTAAVSPINGGGGSGAGYCSKIITPTAGQIFAYAVGAAGSGGAAGTSGVAGANGAAGQINITAYFQ